MVEHSRYIQVTWNAKRLDIFANVSNNKMLVQVHLLLSFMSKETATWLHTNAEEESLT